MCPNCRAFITTDDRVCPYCELKLGPRVIEQRSPGDAIGGLIEQRHFTTMLIMLVNVGLYIATVLYSTRTSQGGFDDLSVGTLRAFGGKDAYLIFVVGQYWRLVTAGYLHGGLMHILMNMLGLYYVGVNVDEVYGTSRYLVIYFLTNVGGYVASSFWAPRVLSIGASAAIFGLIGAMIAVGVRDKSAYGAMVRSMYVRWALYGLAFGILPSLLGFGFMDNAAHLGGIATGFAVGYVTGTPRLSKPAVETAWRIAAGVAVALTVLSFVAMYLSLTTSGA